jgi:hypothetical protein
MTVSTTPAPKLALAEKHIGFLLLQEIVVPSFTIQILMKKKALPRAVGNYSPKWEVSSTVIGWIRLLILN